EKVWTPGAGCSPWTVNSTGFGGGGGARGAGWPGAGGFAGDPGPGTGGGGSTGLGAAKTISALSEGAIRFPSRVAGSRRQRDDAPSAADPKGSSPETACALRTVPSALTTIATMTTASPVAPAGYGAVSGARGFGSTTGAGGTAGIGGCG